MEPADFLDVDPDEPRRPPARRPVRRGPPEPPPRLIESFWAAGGRIAGIGGLVLALSSFMDWYAGSGPVGPTISVIGWHTGVLGKLVFFVGLAVVVLAILHSAGAELSRAVPKSLLVVILGALGTIFVLIRLISIPDAFVGTSGRGIGIWIGLIAALAVIVGGLIQAGEEL
jgi:hypothetical protein